ncbi:MAG TPA: aminotransferase class I/II-fold pyridoxal phosphate-dependent enzyme [Bacteroidetes bacterium]|nr:aminotransferase class I/II-fold pyridoxal phosphate-dependent enzyme [Bacteroidota bacterium]
MISQRMENLHPSGIRRIFDLATKMKNPINLSIGTAFFDVPDPIKKEAIRWMERGLNQYTATRGLPDLRMALRKHLKKQNVQFEDVIVTSGVTGAFLLTLLVLIDPGDEVLIPDPRFVMYSPAVEMIGGVPRFFSTYPDFRIRVEDLEPLVTPRTKAIVVNSPNNPTGIVYSEQELRSIADFARRHDLWIIADEIYEHFLFDGLKFRSVGEFYDKVVLMRGFSKSWAMSGWRIGYIATQQEVIEKMVVAQQYSYVCVAPYVQKAAMVALEYDGSHLIREYEQKRDYAYAELKEIFEIERPQGAFFMFPRAADGDGDGLVERAIASNLLLVPGSAFSTQKTHFRISFSASDEDLKKGIEILKQIANA